jgi:hypothetical protein
MRYGVYRLDVYRAPGWFLVQSYTDLRDAEIYCDMLNTDTNMVHKVFEEDSDSE